MRFHIAHCEGSCATDEKRLDRSLSDSYYAEDVVRNPPEPTQHIQSGCSPGEEHQSDLEQSSSSSISSCHEAEEPDTQQDEVVKPDGNQSGNEFGNGDKTNLKDPDHLLCSRAFS